MLVLVNILFVFVVITQGKKGVGDVDQDWGYITVRPHAHMFWWLYYTTYNVSSYTERPLLIWLQGGPGMSSTGYGNFLEIGPLNANLHKREGSFVENFNVLFIDSPVGAGYSFISDDENVEFVKNGDEVGAELYNFLKIFLNMTHPEFQNVPTFMFGESYGGKMVVELAYAISKDKNQKFCNLKGIGLGDSFISPIDYIDHYGPLSRELGLVDDAVAKEMVKLAALARNFIKQKEFEEAGFVFNKILGLYVHVDINNILDDISIHSNSNLGPHVLQMETLMNGKIKTFLNITESVTWQFENFNIYDSLGGDFIKSATHKVEALLNSTNLKILVYNGILDFIVNTAGTMTWLENLKWKGHKQWLEQNQDYLVMDGVWEAHFKKIDNLAFYAILRAGHSVPKDNLRVINKILELEILSVI